MKIAFVNTNLITCGGIITNFEYVKKLKELGYSAALLAREGNPELEKTYGLDVYPVEFLEQFTDEDVIIANRWEQCEDLEQYKGRKIQFVQGRDLDFDYGEDWKERCRAVRNNPKWELIGVSEYCLQDWNRGTVIPNGINDRFFIDYGLEKDIDALIEGNDEPNKNIEYAIQKAKEDGHQKIVWLGRETHPIEGVECITNPPQAEIPKIYQRAKHFYKYSKSEGFSLPLWEAAASGCTVHTHDMGCNKDWVYSKEEAQKYTWENATQKLIKYLCRK